jgi:6-pyruvoyl tetrahydropterin synthase/QueD family protein
MIAIEKKYHFYAGHRNKNADEKCGRLHGHTYYVTCTFNGGRISEESGITLLFGDIDKLVEPIIKSYDHYFLLYEKDSLCQVFDLAGEEYISLPFETSAENMAIWLFTRIKNETKLPISRIELRETTSSKVVYEEPKS